jgi:Spy/CpxP family protein refolding chaperone
MNCTKNAALWITLLLLASPASAEDPPPFMQELYPPELIMRHGRDVGLSDAQRKAITRAVAETQAMTLELQWDMQDAGQTLAELVSRDRVDEEAALEAATRVMEIEGRVKRAHLALLIRIKNQLSPDQQQRLRQLRAKGP